LDRAAELAVINAYIAAHGVTRCDRELRTARIVQDRSQARAVHSAGKKHLGRLATFVEPDCDRQDGVADTEVVRFSLVAIGQPAPERRHRSVKI